MGASVQRSEPVESSIWERHDQLFNKDGQWAKNKARFRQNVKDIKIKEICQHRMISNDQPSHLSNRPDRNQGRDILSNQNGPIKFKR